MIPHLVHLFIWFTLHVLIVGFSCQNSCRITKQLNWNSPQLRRVILFHEVSSPTRAPHAHAGKRTTLVPVMIPNKTKYFKVIKKITQTAVMNIVFQRIVYRTWRSAEVRNVKFYKKSELQYNVYHRSLCFFSYFRVSFVNTNIMQDCLYIFRSANCTLNGWHLYPWNLLFQTPEKKI